MPTEGTARPQSQPNDAGIRRRKFTWHSPWYPGGTQLGGTECEYLDALWLAEIIGDSNLICK